jgi:hypothetical protein
MSSRRSLAGRRHFGALRFALSWTDGARPPTASARLASRPPHGDHPRTMLEQLICAGAREPNPTISLFRARVRCQVALASRKRLIGVLIAQNSPMGESPVAPLLSLRLRMAQVQVVYARLTACRTGKARMAFQPPAAISACRAESGRSIAAKFEAG